MKLIITDQATLACRYTDFVFTLIINLKQTSLNRYIEFFEPYQRY